MALGFYFYQSSYYNLIMVDLVNNKVIDIIQVFLTSIIVVCYIILT